MVLVTLPPLLAACGADAETANPSATSVRVTATDDSCELERTDLQTGPTTFMVTNDGSSVTEVYIYGQDQGEYTRVIGEVENIGPGTSRDLRVDLMSGSYEVACKPGQTGDGVRTQITVTVGGDEAPSS